ncbi:hypothetical protein AX774_g2071 [Zancudomyces culisetae]|uniref:Uncharacterized protein n=1 Tax=Zancudomyces culisetae TaxID=1213189 RepID=A0A1R1PTX3_ZANCU|nr:hypothetical protein AX774_g2071 [Zancudomyces culisetae]|eukprot:OMH84397.1 hypothetical protein AX774_g2071 [Zancudomyces culisetae]
MIITQLYEQKVWANRPWNHIPDSKARGDSSSTRNRDKRNCVWSVSLAFGVADDGFLYTCGLNEYGQLGRSEFINQYKKKHNDIAKDSQVQNDGNKLTSAIRCINKQQFYSLPEPVEYFEIRDNHDKNNDMTSNTIIDTNTGLGTDSSVCSTSNRNKGLGTDQSKHSSGKYVDPVVYEASCGQFHTLISTDLGVFSCGWAKYGQLGYHPLQSDETSGNSSSIRLHLEPSNTSKNCSFIFRRIDYYNDDSQMAGSKVNGGNSGSTTDYLEVDIAKDEANINILKAKVMCGPWNSFILI